MNTMTPQRRIQNIYTTAFAPYDMDGPVEADKSWLAISWSRETGRGCYLIRLQPGAETAPHEHTCLEEYLILEGDLVESDGTVLKPGDMVSYDQGTYHSSRTENGCLLVGFEWLPESN